MKLECKTCGANLKYVPSAQKAYCEHCGNYFDVREIEYNPEEYDDFEEYTCSSCGATLLTTGKTEIVQCLYCGGKEFVDTRCDRGYDLYGIIPFKIDEEEFRNRLEKYLDEYVATQNLNFANTLRSSEVLGCYLPYSFLNMFFAKQYPIKLNAVLEKILPYNFSELKKFHPIYLDSFVAETIKVKAYGNDMRKRKSSFIWVPVWIAYAEYEGKGYYAVMNGKTGKMAESYKEYFEERGFKDYKEISNLEYEKMNFSEKADAKESKDRKETMRLFKNFIVIGIFLMLFAFLNAGLRGVEILLAGEILLVAIWIIFIITNFCVNSIIFIIRLLGNSIKNLFKNNKKFKEKDESKDESFSAIKYKK